ncbi:MAG TPA: GntR family transcriptional regulator [Xanthobacteraceae bacterium]|nr:GntR family transcriptional regulator [Xanthobacteraceae bacterium]
MFAAAGSHALSRAIPEGLAALLEEEIIFGLLPASARLTEEEVALRYGVSRSPVREALRLLERDGLVLREARRGIWVAPLSIKDFDEVYACRIELEGLAAHGAALSRNRLRKQEFAALLERLRDAAARRDAKEFFLVDVQGSALTYDLADNKTLKRLLAGLEKQALRYRFLAYSRNPGIVDLSLEDTGRIYDAIVDGDAPAAREMTENLIREIWQVMRVAFSQAFGEESAC